MPVDTCYGFLLSGGSDALHRPYVGDNPGIPGDDLVALSNLFLDGDAGIREDSINLDRGALVSLAIWLLSGLQATVDEVRGQQLIYDINVPFERLHDEAANQCLVVLCGLRHRTCLLLANSRFSTGSTPSMMPPGGLWHIGW